MRFMSSLLVILFGAGALAAAPIHYTVSMPRPETHYFEISGRIENVAGPQLRLVMPVWTPGSYLVREFARNVQDFSASAEHKALAWEKVSKNVWQVATDGASVVEVKYRVYANDLGVRTSDLDDEHGYFNGANLFFYPEGRLQEPYKLTVVPKGDWQVATGLDPIEGEPNAFLAPDYDVLVDSPVEMSRFEVLEFSVRGVPHKIVIHGPTRFDRGRMAGDIRKVVEKQVELFGDIPYKRYVFLLHAGLGGGGGLEHLNSTSLQTGKLSFRKERDWEGFLSLVSHEFFHLWNVKRIRPRALGPFNYTQENYTRVLWFSEGVTDYYADLILARAGLVTPKRYLKMVAKAIYTYRGTPGRLVQSASASSFDTWIKQYRPDENSVNSSISYYDKGYMLGLLLDMEIRSRTSGARSLDDVMRYLNENFAKKGVGFPEEELPKIVEQLSGASVDQFWRDYVDGTRELPFEGYLEGAGLLLASKPMPDDKEDREKINTVSFGVIHEEQGGKLMVQSVLTGSPAELGGINAGDEILALDGIRVSAENFAERLRDFTPGDRTLVSVFRGNKLRSFQVTLGPPSPELAITPLPRASSAQRRVFSGWFGADLGSLNLQ